VAHSGVQWSVQNLCQTVMNWANYSTNESK
jgi:hypothetical protein